MTLAVKLLMSVAFAVASSPGPLKFVTSGFVDCVKLVKFVTSGFVDSVKLVKFITSGLVGSVNLVKLVVVVAVVSGQLHEQNVFAEEDLNTGQPGYQFWKMRGSPSAQRDQDILELSVEEKFLRRPTQLSEVRFWEMVLMFSGVTVTSSLKQT